MGFRHVPFIARTIIVANKDVEGAYRLLNRLCWRDGIFDQYRKTRRYEKPFMVRKRINYERCKALYDEDMIRKVNFFSRKNREDPFPAS